MKKIKLTTPVILPQGCTDTIVPDMHFSHVKTDEDLEAFTEIIREICTANHTYERLCHIGGPNILLFKTYQKLQTAIWKLFDRFPAYTTEGRNCHNENKRTVHRSGDIF